ncbi:MAG: c-type cytochrome [Alphaproteobacteria bacterium]|jgi:mono/diheme cytochrome c family protein|nr:c-type cytochrome [Alphaproteobacteria bacterium]
MKTSSRFAAALAVSLCLVGPAMADGETPPVNPFSGDEEIVSEGRTLFNIHCSHCHGPNAAQGERPRDLRRLTLRYREKVNQVYLTTAMNGRPEKGMPPWSEVLEEEALWKVFTFLETVQK